MPPTREPKSIDLTRLWIFTLVAQYGSAAAVAERLRRHRSSVTHDLQALSRQLLGDASAKLIKREGRRGSTLTPTGRRLNAIVAPWFADWPRIAEQLQEELRQPGPRELAVGAGETGGRYIVAPVLSRLLKRGEFSNVQVNQHHQSQAQSLHSLAQGKIQLAVRAEADDTLKPPRQFAWAQFRFSPRVLIARRESLIRGHLPDVLRQRTFVLPAEGNEQRLIRQAFARSACEPKVAIQTHGHETIKEYIRASDFVAIVPDLVVARDDAFESRSLPKAFGGVTWHFVTDPSRPSELAQRVIEAIRASTPPKNRLPDNGTLLA